MCYPDRLSYMLIQGLNEYKENSPSTINDVDGRGESLRPV